MIIKKVFKVILISFSLVGFVFVTVFALMQLGLLNVRGSISNRNSYFKIQQISADSDLNDESFKILCKINILRKYAPETSINIYKTLVKGGNEILVNQMISTAFRRFDTDASFVSVVNSCSNSDTKNSTYPLTAYQWADTDQWALMKEVFIRDKDIINKAAKDAGISPRLVLTGVIGEQFRFFNNTRESFKSYFEPMKILASLSKSSYGIAGLKIGTVKTIEEHLKDPKSEFYLGSDMEHVADYAPDVDTESERMNRITDSKNPYYSYLYIGLFMRQIEKQWNDQGYNVDNRPDVLATLYNLGFDHSVPKANSQAGGAVINIAGVDYTFGDIGYEFYYSGELSDIFPLDSNTSR